MIVWECPDCGATNYDDEEATACPLCTECGEDFFWEDVDVLSEEGGACEICGDPVEPETKLCPRCKEREDWLTWGDWQRDEMRLRFAQ
jgi:rubrerythrin